MMSRLIIYDSQGNKYDSAKAGPGSQEHIQEFFFAGVRVALDLGTTPTVTAFFRAKESDSGRSEQFYAVYEADRLRKLFKQFKNAVQERVQDLGMSIDTSAEDMTVFNNLRSSPPPIPGSDFDHEIISDLLRQGQKVQLGVSDYATALGLFRRYTEQQDLSSAAIADDAQKPALSEFDLVVEKGDHEGLQPLAKTSKLMNRARSNKQDQFLAGKISNIKSEIREIKQHTDLSDDQVRKRLERDLPLLSPPSQQRVGSSGPTSSGQGARASFGSVLPVNIMSVIEVILLSLVVALIITYAYSIFFMPAPFLPEAVVNLLPGINAGESSSSPEEVITDVSINDQTVEFAVNRTKVDQDNVKVSLFQSGTSLASETLSSKTEEEWDNVTLSPSGEVSSGEKIYLNITSQGKLIDSHTISAQETKKFNTPTPEQPPTTTESDSEMTTNQTETNTTSITASPTRTRTDTTSSTALL
jgi:hypothetical protein